MQCSDLPFQQHGGDAFVIPHNVHMKKVAYFRVHDVSGREPKVGSLNLFEKIVKGHYHDWFVIIRGCW